jgi:6-phosphogluconolactonase/glucosamine-6-phosphate isomerase/deaminase
MSLVIKTTTKVEDAAEFVAAKILNELESGRGVLFFVTGGSSINVASEVAKIFQKEIKENPNQDLFKKLTVMLTDERYGPLQHSESNWQQLMIKGFDIPGALLIPILTGDNQIVTTEKFNENLKREFELAEAENKYKISLFGVGPDGHTCGILPNTIAVNSPDLACSHDTATFSRITITPKVIEKFDEGVVWVQGENKWPVIKDLSEKNVDLEKQPAQVLKRIPTLTIFTDYQSR